mgnify:CR=1 FL=1
MITLMVLLGVMLIAGLVFAVSKALIKIWLALLLTPLVIISMIILIMLL